MQGMCETDDVECTMSIHNGDNGDYVILTLSTYNRGMSRPWFIKDSGFSQRVSAEDMRVFAQICPSRMYHKNDVVFHAGDPAISLHILAQGQVKLTSLSAHGSERILAICGENDIIGEAFLQDTAAYQVDAVALTDVTTCPISREQFMQMAQKAPHFALTFAEIMASHLFHCREQLSSSYAPVKTRLAQVLLEQGSRFGQEADNDGLWMHLDTNLKHEDLAAMITATRVSVSTVMAEMRAAGMLEGTRGRYRLNIPALQSLVEL